MHPTRDPLDPLVPRDFTRGLAAQYFCSRFRARREAARVLLSRSMKAGLLKALARRRGGWRDGRRQLAILR
jgi:hypothetical protein